MASIQDKANLFDEASNIIGEISARKLLKLIASDATFSAAVQGLISTHRLQIENDTMGEQIRKVKFLLHFDAQYQQDRPKADLRNEISSVFNSL